MCPWAWAWTAAPATTAPTCLGEARSALLLARVGKSLEPFGCDSGPAEMTARTMLEVATRGGARVLGRDDIGHLAPGMAADLALFDLRTLGFAGGAGARPGGCPAAVRTGAGGLHHRQRPGGGAPRPAATLDLGPLLERHNHLARQLAGG